MDVDRRPPLLVLVGPTAVGKSALALSWAEAVGAEIVQADSTTVYRGLNIGTAKPDREDRDRVPHHLLDLVDPSDSFSAAQFQRHAYAAIDDILERGRLPLLVGGTGLFIRAVVNDYPFEAVGESPWRHRLQDWLAHQGLEALRRKLKVADPESYHRIATGDERRTIRALEVFLTAGRTVSREPGTPRYQVLQVGLRRHRDHLRQRILDRAKSQLSAGLLDEVLGLLAQGVPPHAPAMLALGYREGVEWARGRLALAEVLPLMVLHTAQYAKRQMTWFRRDPDTRWIDLDGVPSEDALKLLRSWTRGLTEGAPVVGDH